MEVEARIAIQLVYALPDAQEVIALDVPSGTTAADALQASGLTERHGISPDSAHLGIYGRRVAPNTMMRSGDRLEVYRALIADPKQARRRRAARTDA